MFISVQGLEMFTQAVNNNNNNNNNNNLDLSAVILCLVQCLKPEALC